MKRSCPCQRKALTSSSVWAAAVALAMVAPPAWADAEPGQGENPLEAASVQVFKEFLANEHDTGEILFSWRFVKGGVIPGTDIQIPTTPRVHRAKWQPGSSYSIYLDTTNVPAALASGGFVMAVGKAGRNAWHFENGYLHRYEGAEANAAQGAFASQQTSAQHQLFTALGFGIPFLPGTLVWDGLTFKAFGFNRQPFEGQLVLSKQGVPEQILIPPASRGRSTYRIQLVYPAGQAGDSLPAGYDYLETLADGTTRPTVEGRLVSLSVTNAASPEAAFCPEAVLGAEPPSAPSTQSQAQHWETIVHSNHQQFVARSNGLVLMPRHAARSGLPKRMVVYGLIVITASFSVFFFLTRKGSHKKYRHIETSSLPEAKSSEPGGLGSPRL